MLCNWYCILTCCVASRSLDEDVDVACNALSLTLSSKLYPCLFVFRSITVRYKAPASVIFGRTLHTISPKLRDIYILGGPKNFQDDSLAQQQWTRERAETSYTVCDLAITRRDTNSCWITIRAINARGIHDPVRSTDACTHQSQLRSELRQSSPAALQSSIWHTGVACVDPTAFARRTVF